MDALASLDLLCLTHTCVLLVAQLIMRPTPGSLLILDFLPPGFLLLIFNKGSCKLLANKLRYAQIRETCWLCFGVFSVGGTFPVCGIPL